MTIDLRPHPNLFVLCFILQVSWGLMPVIASAYITGRVSYLLWGIGCFWVAYLIYSVKVV